MIRNSYNYNTPPIVDTIVENHVHEVIKLFEKKPIADSQKEDYYHTKWSNCFPG